MKTYELTLDSLPGVTFTVSDFDDDGEQFVNLHGVTGLEGYDYEAISAAFHHPKLQTSLNAKARKVAAQERKESAEDYDRLDYRSTVGGRIF